ncbi:MAG: anion transporter [Elusimicrobia bacterium GWC2_51_8]|nr:MAG: anion transporter [Elusimicrobia bacterium GWA2_51_34]OGR58769.1 MAG: anion transporter [Elusimicrobia bacterium GWC2_51_8]HAF94988.1 anion transporter [Elusimicrobiota bacterium]HCE99096.1 anion transporter [Elusimicrobiota bacterium]
MFPIITLVTVFLLIAVRQVGRVRFEIWQVMVLGALAVLLSGSIAPLDAFRAIDLDVIFFLFGMFVLGQALELSGYLSHLEYKTLKHAGSGRILLLFILFGSGCASAFLMNDTLAIVGTPVMLLLSKKHNIRPKALLIALAFGVTIGSAASPIGNPQNLLIALKGGVADPFVTFFMYLAAPTVINLFAAFFLIRFFYPDEFENLPLKHSQEPIKDHALAILCRISLVITAGMIVLKIYTVGLAPRLDFRLTYIALSAAMPVFLFSRRRFEILKKIDWSTLAFFAAMFILMKSVWNTGFFQGLLAETGVNIASVGVITAVSVTLSQLISNVPLVALYLPMLSHLQAEPRALMALAAASTVAGNLFILGAASNVIIIQTAEKRAGQTITFWEFTRVGAPLTFINCLVYWIFLRFL